MPRVLELDTDVKRQEPEKVTLPERQRNSLLKLLISEARQTFRAFLYFLHPPGYSDYLLGPLHLHLADIVDGMLCGMRHAYQAVSVPPQHGKSQLLAVRASAFILGHQPGVRVALTGFSHDLLVEMLADIRRIMETPEYQLIFPGVAPVEGFNRQDEMRLTNGSSIIAKSTGRKLTGRRVDWLVMDDVHAGREEAESKTQRAKIQRWYFGDCVSRLHPTAKVFLLGTRWHPEDLIGHLTSENYVQQLRTHGRDDLVYEITNLPAIAEQNDILGREIGEALFPEERPIDFLEGVRLSIPRYEWDSQYRGKPSASGSGQVNLFRVNRGLIINAVPTNIPWVRGWDLALTEKQTSDYSCGALCAYDRETKDFFVIDMFRRKLAWARLKPRLLRISLQDKIRYNCNRMGLEAVSGFKIGLSEIRESLQGEVRVEERNPPRGGKLMRAQDWLNTIEAGRFHLVQGAWNKDFLDELEMFPDGEHDDQIDAVSIAWESLVRRKKLLYA